MKKSLFIIAAISSILGGCSKYDDDALWDRVNDHEERISTLETTVNNLNNDIVTIGALVANLENNISIKSIETISGGVRITFSDNSTYDIVNGANGADGNAPAISIRAEEGVYYWTIDGKWLLQDGTTSDTAAPVDRVRASGEGVPGETPVIGINSAGNWTVTVGGTTSEILVNGQPVKAQGPKGDKGDSLFENIDTETMPGYVIFTLSDNSTIAVPTTGEFLTFTNVPGLLFEMPVSAASSITFTKTSGIVKVGIASSIPLGWTATVDNAAGKINLTSPASAANIDLLVVATTNTGNSASYWITVSTYSVDLQALIDGTADGGTLVLDKPEYLSTGGVVIDKNITISSSVGSKILVSEPVSRTPAEVPFAVGRLDGKNPAILITGDVTVNLSGIALSAVAPYHISVDGITLVGGTLNLDEVAIDGIGYIQPDGSLLLTGDQYGRGVTVYNGTLNVTNSIFRNINKNSIHVQSGNATIDGSTFQGNNTPGIIAQNGAVFMPGTSGSVSNSSFTGFRYFDDTHPDQSVAVYPVDGTASVTDGGGNSFADNDIDWNPVI